MKRQAVVGLFSIFAIIGLFVIFWFLNNLGTKLGGYRMGVRFPAAAGLRPGSQVLLSGLAIGTVDRIVFAPDYTVDVILAIKGSIPVLSFLPGSAPPSGYDVPKGSTFLVQAPLTGDASVVILPPPPAEAKSAGSWPHEVLALDEQPAGKGSASFQDVLAQGGGMLTDLQRRLPSILDGLKSAVNNANDMAIHGNELTQHLSMKLDSLTGKLQTALDEAGGNITAITRDFRDVTRSNRGRLESVLAHLNSATVGLNEAVDSMRALAGDQQLRGNLLQTSQNIADASALLAKMAASAQQLTGDPQTQAQLRDTVAQLNAVMQKANSLLAAIGGTSSVYGVDAGATPAPAPTIVPSGGHAPQTVPSSGGTKTVPDSGAQRVTLNKFVKTLVGFEVRLNELNPAPVNGLATPILGTNRGPQSDFNLVVLPHAPMSFVAGANNLGPPPNGGQTTYNFALLTSVAPGLRAGAGVLYSTLGLMSQYTPPKSGIGFQGLIYNPQYPTMDAYGTLHVAPKAAIFGGERDILHSGRRTVFGLQLNF
ncbi:MAG TPA: MlaD family protein [Candidatus Binatia bacterium]|nr:MlaD family protein [Candidatus Binatia bacterium]